MEAWLDNLDSDPDGPRLKAKVTFVFAQLMTLGHLVGQGIFAKLHGVDDLWEAKVNVGNRAVRIFGGFAAGHRVCLTAVLDGKKRQSLQQKDYKRYERMVKEHVALVTGGKG